MSKRRKNSKSNGFKSSLSTGFVILVLIGGVMGWMNVNGITSATGVYDYFKAVADKVQDCGAGELKWNCETGLDKDGNQVAKPGEKPSDSKTPSNDSKTPEGNNTPKDETNVSNTPSEGKKEAIETLATLTVADPQVVDYQRSQWRHWTGSPCNTRETVLKNQGTGVKADSKTCKILSGSWFDVYSAQYFTEAGKLDIDHVIPLGYAAKNGGNGWDAAKKEKFANDNSHLLAVSATENRKKSDKGPGAYMPPNKDFHCSYAKIWVTTASKYQLSINKKDSVALTAALQKCSS